MPTVRLAGVRVPPGQGGTGCGWKFGFKPPETFDDIPPGLLWRSLCDRCLPRERKASRLEEKSSDEDDSDGGHAGPQNNSIGRLIRTSAKNRSDPRLGAALASRGGSPHRVRLAYCRRVVAPRVLSQGRRLVCRHWVGCRLRPGRSSSLVRSTRPAPSRCTSYVGVISLGARGFPRGPSPGFAVRPPDDCTI